ncbi:valine--tRNA ligase [Mycoplasmopsis anatis]|uniref:Valine--tRNA ligase n=1 Tax=Mycoplasmopsis anatis TaxID=171279 RepID=A0A9Q3QDC8_9BACT|nr:valine--tRNA ligase [Mycoplasmopsis anatis]MBW0594507.1 valine--tRNA ligase [Mycoplasmopsis anatis]MBW0595244.1 valine--tRNA ligase [Mycoplasmopsis anatis]MBW0596144.1 valine--tRNA ligase [Mycoplasmopsis anatis]MBW0596828.1 valine--tRNA ligase [Mycoplasmopsis anatis]MBW0597640.1 valine--tRNA ligase [Mycoplasmopsis anatis]
MEKIYNHKEVEKNIEKKWQEKRYFMNHDERKKPFSILLPPPNVTGKLHLGHALDSYIPDTIIRYKKLNNYDVFWIAGMDHAGIATQAKVEQTLYENKGLTRHDLGREEFLKLVWEWKKDYAQTFRKQWASLGLALDYSNERFTLDESANNAVLKVFIELYNKGLIYRDIKAINWDPELETALSNIEVVNKPTEQKMYYIKYFIENSSEFLEVATVRTETLLSDVALVYNPEDKRYKHLQGKFAIHPITKRKLPIIEDDYVDKDFGSGVMKLSAHAEVDIEIIKKHGLEIIETIDKRGYINSPNSTFDKLERFEAREAIAKFLSENNYLTKVENSISNVGYSDRSKAPIEILVMPQWFVKMDKFAKDILEHLNSEEKVDFFPSRFESTLKQWMENVYDWTISRQLWWGHQIPCWYKNNEIKVQIECPGEGWVQDQDVLDTWFSSGLAPFAFLGWPDNDEKLKRYYPGDVLVTGYDLIFFWIARMYLFGLEFQNKKPFKHVLLHGLIRDEQNRKMSKSLNNGIDPIDVVEKYGSDALRWFLIANTTPGMDIRYSPEKIQVAWAMNNKLWNIARYISEMEDNSSIGYTDADKWITNKIIALQSNIDKFMEKYEFTLMCAEVNKFIYNDFSSWYIELIKLNASKKVSLEILKNILIILHPFMPFITDRLFSDIFNEELLENSWPKLEKFENVEYIDTLIEIISTIRRYREENQISKKEVINYYFDNELNEIAKETIKKMAIAEFKNNNDAIFALNSGNLFIEIDTNQREINKQRLLEKIEKVKFEINRATNMLNNKSFTDKAPADKVQAERDKLEKYQEELKIYEEELRCKY